MGGALLQKLKQIPQSLSIINVFKQITYLFLNSLLGLRKKANLIFLTEISQGPEQPIGKKQVPCEILKPVLDNYAIFNHIQTEAQRIITFKEAT